MLKKIRVDDVRVGMHLHELCGAWLDHPFWKSRFVLRDPDDLRKLRASAVVECWIDTAKGLDVATPDDGVPIARAPARSAPREPEAPCHEAPKASPMAAEVQRAAALIGDARAAVASLYNEARMGRALDVDKCLPLVDEIASSVWRNPGAIVSLARLKSNDDYTYMHSVAVCALMDSLGRQLGLDEARCREAGLAGLVHDMGKAAMPIEVLNKPGKLTPAEFEIIKSHPARGHEMLRDGGSVGDAALDVCLHHHERMDGKGYPDGLAGEAIAPIARMGAVCDVYDAITSNRPYKAGWDPADSVAKMASWGPGQFDAAIFQAFVRSLGIYPIGSLVKMQSGRLAVVVEQNEQSLVAPWVKVFFSTRSNMPIAVELLDLSQPSVSDRIVGRESNAQWKFPHLDELWAGPEALKKMAR